MSTQFCTSLAEGQSINCPPLFDGANYSSWKNRMRIYIQAYDYQQWKVIIKGPHTPTIKVNDLDVPKLEENWNEHDIKMAELNAKAMNVLYCALDQNEFNWISTCNSAKEIWDKLQSIHEGTSQVKESKIDLLVHEHESFKTEHLESISDVSIRSTDIINDLNSLGKVYTDNELISKTLRCLPKTWEAKMTAIEEAKDPSKLSMAELIGSLMSHELNVWRMGEEKGPKKGRTIVFESMHKSKENDVSEEEEEGIANFCNVKVYIVNSEFAIQKLLNPFQKIMKNFKKVRLKILL